MSHFPAPRQRLDSKDDGALASIRKWYSGQRNRLMSCAIRVSLWSIGVLVAIFPAIQLSQASYTFDMQALSLAVFKAGHFKDLFFVTIVVAILGVSNIFDNMVRSRGVMGDVSIICFLGLLVLFIWTLLYSTSQFVLISTTPSILTLTVLQHDADILRNTLLAGLATEIVIALREPPANSNGHATPTDVVETVG